MENSVGILMVFVCVICDMLLCNRLMIIMFFVWFFGLFVRNVVVVVFLCGLVECGVVFFIGCVCSMLLCFLMNSLGEYDMIYVLFGSVISVL